MKNLIQSVLFTYLVFALTHHAVAQEDERAPSPTAAGVVLDIRGVGSAAPGDLVAGVGGFLGDVSNDGFVIDTVANTSQSIFSGLAVGGMAYDAVNSRVLITASQADDVSDAEFSTLFEWPIAGGVPTEVGNLTRATDGSPLRADGLAFAGGVFYAMSQFEDAGPGSAGLYSIDLNTLVGTQVASVPDGAISGIGADSVTGVIYAVNDADGELQSIALDGTLTPIAAYPVDEPDIDGLAVGGGFAYMVPDDDMPGSIFVYDIGAGTYVTPLTAPWVGAEVFSGAAYISELQLPESQPVPTLNNWAVVTLMLVLMGIGILVLNRRIA